MKLTPRNKNLFHVRVISPNTVFLVITYMSQPYKKPTNLFYQIARYILRMKWIILVEAIRRLHMRVIPPSVYDITDLHFQLVNDKWHRPRVFWFEVLGPKKWKWGQGQRSRSCSKFWLWLVIAHFQKSYKISTKYFHTIVSRDM